MIEKLIARQAVSGRVAIIFAPQGRKSETPVDVILLHRVGQPLDINDALVELHRVRRVHVGCRPVAARLHCVGADVAAEIDPAVDLDMRVVERLADIGVRKRGHQRAVHGIGPGHPDAGRAAIRPLGERIGGSALWRRRPAGPATRRRRRIGRRRVVPHFQRVVVYQAGPEIVADAPVPILRIRRRISPRIRCSAHRREQ